jgi:hypothetical protein
VWLKFDLNEQQVSELLSMPLAPHAARSSFEHERQDGDSGSPRRATERFVECGEFQTMIGGKGHKMSVGNVVAAVEGGQRRSRCVIDQELVSRKREDFGQRLTGVSKTRSICGTHTYPQEAHLNSGAGGEARQSLEPTVGFVMAIVRLSGTGREQIDIQQVTHPSSSRIALTRSAVIGGALGGSDQNGTPEFAPD